MKYLLVLLLFIVNFAHYSFSEEIQPDTLNQSATDNQENEIPFIFKKEKKNAMAGAALVGSGFVVKYALLLPAQLNIDPDNAEDGLALMGPSILSVIMIDAGNFATLKNSSKAVDSYIELTGLTKPTNLAWTFFFSSLGFNLASSGLDVLSVMFENEDYSKYSFVVSGIADAIIVLDEIYSIAFISRLGKSAETHLNKRTSDSKITLFPYAIRGGAGIILTGKF